MQDQRGLRQLAFGSKQGPLESITALAWPFPQNGEAPQLRSLFGPESGGQVKSEGSCRKESMNFEKNCCQCGGGWGWGWVCVSVSLCLLCLCVLVVAQFWHQHLQCFPNSQLCRFGALATRFFLPLSYLAFELRSWWLCPPILPMSELATIKSRPFGDRHRKHIPLGHVSKWLANLDLAAWFRSPEA